MRNALYDHDNPFHVFALSVTTAYQEHICYNSLACIKVQEDTSSYQFTCYATNRKIIWLPCKWQQIHTWNLRYILSWSIICRSCMCCMYLRTMNTNAILEFDIKGIWYSFWLKINNQKYNIKHQTKSLS